jgi:acyl carrier protein
VVDVDSDVVLLFLQHAVTELGDATAPILTMDTPLGGDSEIDSLGLIEIVMLVEEEFDIIIRAGDLDGIRTVGMAVDLITNRIGAS